MESVHSFAACASDDAGAVQLAIGDIDSPVFLRSSIKPFIAATVIASGAADAYGFDDAEIALIAASHAGEPGHVAAARSMLAKAGIAESALRCGGAPPLGAIANNCSGKHAGILALAKRLGAPLETYLEADHPAERALIEMCARMFGVDARAIPLAVDGCGIPTLAITLRTAAHGFARFATLRGVNDADAAALVRVKAAMTAKPWYVAGTGRFDTALLEAGGGAVVGKGGAEGVHCDALARVAGGLAIKVADGANRAVAPATLALLNAVGALGEPARNELAAFERPLLTNAAGNPIGHIQPRLPPSHNVGSSKDRAR